MEFVYYLGSAIGFCFIAIICYIIAILFAKKVNWLAWTIYLIGTGITLLPLIGNSMKISKLSHSYLSGVYGLNTLKDQLTVQWVVFVILAFLTLVFIISRNDINKAEKLEEAKEKGAGQTALTDEARIAVGEGNLLIGSNKFQNAYAMLYKDGSFRFSENAKYRLGYQDKSSDAAGGPIKEGRVLFTFNIRDIKSMVPSEKSYTKGGWHFSLDNGTELDAFLTEDFFAQLVAFMGV